MFTRTFARSLYLSIAVLFVLLTAPMLVGATKVAPLTDNTRPIYVPTAPARHVVECGTTQTIAAVEYWPLATEHVYTAHFYARGGGNVILTAPGVHDSVAVPADNEQRVYMLTVDRIPNGANGISLVASGGPCHAPHGGIQAAPLVIDAPNLHVGP